MFAAPQGTVPMLESGDRLSREAFERLYAQCPHIKKAELINGVVYVASPVRVNSHSRPHSLVMGWLMAFEVATANVMVLDNATVRLDAQTVVQPDALLRLVNGTSCISGDDYLEGAPELIVEIASSSAAYDLHDKLEVYCRCGVQEYLVWVVPEQDFHWYLREGTSYRRQAPDDHGIFRSGHFSGLWLHWPALRDGHLTLVLETLHTGLKLQQTP
ncbi:Uma2 family endonuclease [Thermosynechococcus sp. PP45]|uniref:Uma2 family endonuclease n=1 Tax=unclassified Thermosynechococcus TaxID=2622553 RepID=UPI002671B9EB|nr:MULTISPECIES: Uma2 family endonuclease [unclassified Thermosynechococcus]MDR7920975.1 Uma2 family endonuclease [Thermosynechococcus sp. HY213]WKT81608.1 Uma2 family endonuclease [Thermosynechococcus sp. PP45]WNC25220.1 Uma2 family endonuclease [Thermosynechococcus sp. PP551]WNC27798.1 Uma2 family endonuclease [Thermosynechococcus sp. PP555]